MVFYMKLKGVDLKISAIIGLVCYYGFAQFLPECLGGKVIRRICAKMIFKKCGTNVNVKRRACFGSGRNIEIGNNSDIGLYAQIPSNTIIGNDVMIGPRLIILAQNHSYDRLDIPMKCQKSTPPEQTIIGNDVWIGRNVIITPGRTISDGTLVAAGCVLCKDFPAYSIVGGNPSRIIKSRTGVMK